MAIDPADPGTDVLAFLAERHLATLATLRPDGSPHVVPVGVTYDPATRTARVITSGMSAKARHVRDGGGRVAVCQ
jgi:nitroimidazol reductase NimA-like FMN-containing flavoprotein (pyridoxamine 5'-phosphate oxidase superfamily)